MEEYLPDTQSQEYIEASQRTQEVRTPWGRLCACVPTLDSIDLFNATYTLGRAPGCDIIIEKSHFAYFLNISKEHFRLSREEDIVYITDLSKNGTFVNSHRVSKYQRHIIHTDDVIAIGQPSAKVFIFSSYVSFEDHNFLPKKMRELYFVSKLLGRGGCGEVRLAHHKQTCELYAIKKIIKARSSTNIGRLNHPSKIKTEIDILTSLSHPFIINMKEIYETENEVFLVLEYMKGGELTNRILSIIPFPEAEVKFVFYQILLAVQYLHSNGITHRDLKPENVLLLTDDCDPVVKISDFGLSKIMEEVSAMETTCGTISYVAPEVLHCLQKYTKKVDIWSLGVLLFYMLCKSLPFVGPDRESISLKILAGKIDWEDKSWNTISPSAKDLVKRMLTVNPNRRIGIDEILKHAWISKDAALQYKLGKLTTKEDDKDSDSDDVPAKRLRFSLSVI